MTRTINYEFISENFPTLREMVYLNNAATGIPPMATITAMKQYLDNRVNAKGDFKETKKALGEIRENLGILLGGKSSEFR